MAPKKKKAAPSAGPALESKARTSSKGKRKENADGAGDVIEKEGETVYWNTAGADSSVIPAPAENQVTSADELKSEVLEADVAVSTSNAALNIFYLKNKINQNKLTSRFRSLQNHLNPMIVPK